MWKDSKLFCRLAVVYTVAFRFLEKILFRNVNYLVLINSCQKKTKISSVVLPYSNFPTVLIYQIIILMFHPTVRNEKCTLVAIESGFGQTVFGICTSLCFSLGRLLVDYILNT